MSVWARENKRKKAGEAGAKATMYNAIMAVVKRSSKEIERRQKEYLKRRPKKTMRRSLHFITSRLLTMVMSRLGRHIKKWKIRLDKYVHLRER